MNLKNFGRNDTKIKEQKNIIIPLCVVLAVSSVAGAIACGINVKQTKEIENLEAITKPEEDRMKEYREEVKKYFASYIGSDKAKQDILTQLDMDTVMYQELEEKGILNTDLLSEEDMDEIIGLAVAELNGNNIISNSSDVHESAVYQTLYNDVLYKVRKNLTENNALTVYQTITYDTEKVTTKATEKIQAMQKKLESQNKTIDAEAVRNAYISTIVDDAVKNLNITTDDETRVKKEVMNQLYAFFNSEEGKKLSHQGKDGKDGTDGKAVDLTTAEMQNMIQASYDTLLQYVSDPANNVNVTPYEGRGIDLEETADRIDVMPYDQGNKMKITLCWNRGDWDEMQKDKQITIKIPSFGSMEYIPNNDVSSYNINALAEGESKTSTIILSYEGKNGTSREIKVADLTEAFANTYTHYIYEDLRTRYIGGAEYDESGKLVCTVLTVPDDENSKCGIELTDDDHDGIFSCPVHNTKLITLDDLFEQLNKTMDAAVDTVMKTNYDFEFNGKQKIDDSELLKKAATVDSSVEIIETYILDNYRELLRAMDKGYSDNGIYIGNSVFHAYDKAFKDLKDDNSEGINHYGTSSMITPSSDPKLANEAVIVQKLMTDGYIIREESGNLEFKGDNNTEKLQKAVDSQIVKIVERYVNYTVHDTGNASTSILGKIQKWETELKESLQLINLLYGNGIIFTIGTDNCVYTFSDKNKDLLDKYINHGTRVPVNFTIIRDDIDETNAKQNYADDVKNSAIQRVYYQDGKIYITHDGDVSGLKLSCSLSALKLSQTP